MTEEQDFNELSQDCVKVVFRFYSDLFEKEMIETLWCRPLDPELGLYQVDNIPFYAHLIAADDLILAEKDDKEGGMLAYRHTVKESGNSTIHLVKLDESFDLKILIDELVKLGCNYEGMDENYFAIDVPCDVVYSQVRNLLDDHETKDLAGFSEACLSDLHQNQLD